MVRLYSRRPVTKNRLRHNMEVSTVRFASPWLGFGIHISELRVCAAGPHMSYAQAELYSTGRRDSRWMTVAARILLCLAAILIAMMLDARAESCQLSTEMDAGL